MTMIMRVVSAGEGEPSWMSGVVIAAPHAASSWSAWSGSISQHAELWLSASGGPVDVGFEVDDPGAGQRVADTGLGVVDGGGDVSSVGMARHGDLGGDQELVRSEMHGAQVDDPVDTRSFPQRGLDLVDLFGYGGLPDQQAGGLSGQENRDRREQDADAEACHAVVDPVAGEDREPDAEQGQGQSDEGTAVLEQKDRQFR